jgi:hypothetical protein
MKHEVQLLLLRERSDNTRAVLFEEPGILSIRLILQLGLSSRTVKLPQGRGWFAWGVGRVKLGATG